MEELWVEGSDLWNPRAVELFTLLKRMPVLTRLITTDGDEEMLRSALDNQCCRAVVVRVASRSQILEFILLNVIMENTIGYSGTELDVKPPTSCVCAGSSSTLLELYERKVTIRSGKRSKANTFPAPCARTGESFPHPERSFKNRVRGDQQ